MFKKLFFVSLLAFCASTAGAQEVFWGFDENNRELIVPQECDGAYPAEEMYKVGMRLLEETGYAKQGAPFCLLAAALDNHPEAQYQVARLYQKGILLPKSDLAAYKWATIAALNGVEEADRLGANLEQFMSIQDIESATKSLGSLLPTITEATQKRLDDEVDKQEKMLQEIEMAKRDIKSLKKYGRIEVEEDVKPVKKTKKKKSTTQKKTKKSILTQERENRAERAKANEAIFSQEDLDNAPMPAPY